MFYVNPTNSKKTNNIFDRKTKRKSIRSEQELIDSKSVFKAKLQETIIDKSNRDIEILLEEIYTAGNVLYNNSTIGNLLKYKECVKKFLSIASKSIFKITVLRGRKLDLKIVRVINEKLKFITDNFFELQKDKMELLSTIKEIKGLVINILY